MDASHDPVAEWLRVNAAQALKALINPANRVALMALLGRDNEEARSARRRELAARELLSMELRWVQREPPVTREALEQGEESDDDVTF